MFDTGHVPTQMTSGRSRCFRGAPIDNATAARADPTIKRLLKIDFAPLPALSVAIAAPRW